MKKLLAPIAITGLLLTGCGSSTEAQPNDPADCQEVSGSLQSAITNAASGVEMKPVKAAAVQSQDFEQVFMVAVEFSAPGGDNQTGVWATDSLNAGDGLILSVDGVAKSFTTWPGGATQDVVPSDHGVDEAKQCLS